MDMTSDLSVDDGTSSSTGAGTLTITLTGDVDSLVAYQPYEEVVAGFDRAPSIKVVIIDVSGVGFIDSTGLGTLVRIQTHAAEHGATCAIRGVQPRLRRLLDMTGLSGNLTLV